MCSYINYILHYYIIYYLDSLVSKYMYIYTKYLIANFLCFLSWYKILHNEYRYPICEGLQAHIHFYTILIGIHSTLSKTSKSTCRSCRQGRVPYDYSFGALTSGCAPYDRAFGALIVRS